MGTLNLRAALFFAFAAFLVVQCSCDSSEQFEEPSDEIKRQLSSPEMLEDGPEMPSDGPSDRRKRSSTGSPA
uniref:Secreted protein n=1 Tax=Globodera rostochiensis TaxID=31243 RepID=A0A914GZV7_GLORO